MIAESHPRGAAATKAANLLFVDDEPKVLNSMRAMFRRDYNVFLADSGESALELMRDQPIDVIVSDQRMPSMTGVEMLKEVKRRAPHAMRILLTGYADLKAIEEAINEGEVFRYLVKPCPVEELRETVALAVEAATGTAPRITSWNTPASTPAVTPRDESRASSSPAQTASRPVPERASPKTGPVARPAPEPESAPPSVAPRPRPRAVPREDRVELMVLTKDEHLVRALHRAFGGGRVWHRAESIEQAVTLLESHAIGVVVTDVAVDERGVRELTTELKRHVPELVTIVASHRSDAQTLIELINYGQIFRFLLKPVQPGQCRLWIESAIRKHIDLIEHPSATMRHRVSGPVEPASGGLMSGLLARMRQIKNRFVHFDPGALIDAVRHHR